jgi:tRNA nucleotidyltransferase (CCA-adding enzyme)
MTVSNCEQFMQNLSAIQEHVLRKHLRPTSRELALTDQCFTRIRKSVKQCAKENQLKISFISLEGSSGLKQTQLRNSRELDVFIGLPQQLLIDEFNSPHPPKTHIRKYLGGLVRRVAFKAAELAGCQNIDITHAEHPYVTAVLDNHQVDLVFCFDLPLEYISENGPITAVDRTIHHSRFISEHLSLRQRDEVRLLKAFFQSGFVYGDMSPVGRSGFTGFSAEILIYHTHNFVNALEELIQIPLKPLDYFGRSISKLREQFKADYLIIIDPTDPNRNLAASISKRSYNYATHLARQLFANPDPGYFIPRDIPLLSPKEEKQLGKNYLIAIFDDKTGWHYTKTRDKLYKYFGNLCSFLSHEATGENRFGKCLFEEVFIDRTFAIALQIEHPHIEPTFLRVGPPSELAEAVRHFLKKHPNAILKNGRYFTDIKRKFTDVEEAARYYLDEHVISPKLRLTHLSHTCTQKIGRKALWILRNAILPFLV